MGKPGKYDNPTPSFPYKINRRINMLSRPKKLMADSLESIPAFTPTGVRKSALHGHVTDRVNDAAFPYVRRLLYVKRMFKNRFPPERLERIEKMIELANSTIYAKLANATLDLKKSDVKDVKKKRGWTETEWKKHMDYITTISIPRKAWEPPEVERGESKPLTDLMPTINRLAEVPPSKMYRRLSEEIWYRNPQKVSPKALKYNISDRIKWLAQAHPPQPTEPAAT